MARRWSPCRLAFADDVTGPYRVHPPGALHPHDSWFPTETPTGIVPTSTIQAAAIEAEGYAAHFTPHIASPDVVVDHERRTIWMSYHGLCDEGSQLTRMAHSTDGLYFEAHEPLVAFPYLRVVSGRLDYGWLAMSMPGIVCRSPDVLTWEAGPMLFDADFRHCALLHQRGTLRVFWTSVGDAPEHILHSTMALTRDWTTWTPSPPSSVLRPEEPWKGADLPVEASVRSQVTQPVHQLRDPAIFTEGGRVWLLYAIAGESGIAIAEIHDLSG